MKKILTILAAMAMATVSSAQGLTPWVGTTVTNWTTVPNLYVHVPFSEVVTGSQSNQISQNTANIAMLTNALIGGNMTDALARAAASNAQITANAANATGATITATMSAVVSTQAINTAYLATTITNNWSGALVTLNTNLALYGTNPKVQEYSYGGSSAYGTWATLAAGGVRGGETALTALSVIGQVEGWGYDGTSYGTGPGAYIQFHTVGSWSPTSHGALIDFYTTPLSSTTAAKAMRIYSDRTVEAYSNLTVDGTLFGSASDLSGYSLGVPGLIGSSNAVERLYEAGVIAGATGGLVSASAATGIAQTVLAPYTNGATLGATAVQPAALDMVAQASSNYSAAVAASAAGATNAAHVAAVDPHGDRAYAGSLMATGTCANATAAGTALRTISYDALAWVEVTNTTPTFTTTVMVPISESNAWQEAAYNPILSGIAGQNDSVQEPEAFYYGGQWWLYYSAKYEDGAGGIWLATGQSLNSLTNVYTHPVVGQGWGGSWGGNITDAVHSNIAVRSTVFGLGHSWFPTNLMWYGTNVHFVMYSTEGYGDVGNRIQEHMSVDGTNWWYCGKIASPVAPDLMLASWQVCPWNGQYLALYDTTQSGNPWDTGIAWAPACTGPWTRASSPLNFFTNTISSLSMGHHSPRVVSGKLHTWCHGNPAGVNTPSDLYHYYSADGTNWTAWGPNNGFVATKTQPWEGNDQLADACVYEYGGVSYLFHDAVVNSPVLHAHIGVMSIPYTLATLIAGLPTNQTVSVAIVTNGGSGASLTGITAAQVGAVSTNDARYLASLTNNYGSSVVLNTNLTVNGNLTILDGQDYQVGKPSGAPASNAGRLYCNSVAGRNALYWQQPNGAIIRYGRDTVFTAINDEATALTNGEAVFFTVGKISNTTHYCKRACANSATTMPAQGIIADGGSPIAPGGYCTVMYLGRTDTALGIDTTGHGEGWTNSQVLYVSPTVPGQLTLAKPTAPNYIQDMGLVNAVSASAGSIDVRTKVYIQATDTSVLRTWQLWSASNSVLNASYKAMRTLDYGSTGVGIWTNNTVTNNQYFGFLSGPAGAGLTLLRGGQLFQVTPTMWIGGGGNPALSLSAEFYIRHTDGSETEITPSSGTEPQAMSSSQLQYIYSFSFTQDISMVTTDSILIKFKASGKTGNPILYIGQGYLNVPLPSTQFALQSDLVAFEATAVTNNGSAILGATTVSTNLAVNGNFSGLGTLTNLGVGSFGTNVYVGGTLTAAGGITAPQGINIGNNVVSYSGSSFVLTNLATSHAIYKCTASGASTITNVTVNLSQPSAAYCWETWIAFTNPASLGLTWRNITQEGQFSDITVTGLYKFACCYDGASVTVRQVYPTYWPWKKTAMSTSSGPSVYSIYGGAAQIMAAGVLTGSIYVVWEGLGSDYLMYRIPLRGAGWGYGTNWMYSGPGLIGYTGAPTPGGTTATSTNTFTVPAFTWSYSECGPAPDVMLPNYAPAAYSAYANDSVLKEAAFTFVRTNGTGTCSIQALPYWRKMNELEVNQYKQTHPGY